jgi:hypothetical protein
VGGWSFLIGALGSITPIREHGIQWYDVLLWGGLLMMLASAVVLLARRQFSLRALLIATTLVAVVLGLIVYFAGH